MAWAEQHAESQCEYRKSIRDDSLRLAAIPPSRREELILFPITIKYRWQTSLAPPCPPGALLKHRSSVQCWLLITMSNSGEALFLIAVAMQNYSAPHSEPDGSSCPCWIWQPMIGGTIVEWDAFSERLCTASTVYLVHFNFFSFLLNVYKVVAV